MITKTNTADPRWKHRYPWDEWFSTQSLGFRIDRGKGEFSGRTDTMVQQIRNKCYGKYHRRAHISVSDNGNIITVVFKDTEDK